MDKSRINLFIFDTLSSRKSISIPQIGTIVVIRRGSSMNNNKKFADFPHYELAIHNTKPALDLLTELNKIENVTENDLQNWLDSISKKQRGYGVITIPKCMEIKMKSNIVKSISCFPELNIQFNPFSQKKRKSNISKSVGIFLSTLVIIGAVYYVYLSLDLREKTPPTVEQEPKIEEKVAEIIAPIIPPPIDTTLIARDSTIQQDINVVDSLKIEKEEVAIPKKENSNKPTKIIKGDSYVVIGSFKLLSKAIEDKERLLKIYKDIEINTTRKTDGYINYIYTSSSTDEAVQKQIEYSEKYRKIKGIWVYDYK